jgi:hypothetical protein
MKEDSFQQLIFRIKLQPKLTLSTDRSRPNWAEVEQINARIPVQPIKTEQKTVNQYAFVILIASTL